MNTRQRISNATPLPWPITSAGYKLTHVKGIDPEADVAADLELQRMIAIYEASRASMHPHEAMQDGKRVIYWDVRFPKGSPHKSGPLAVSPSSAMMKNYYANKAFPGITINQARGDKDAIAQTLGGGK